MGTGFPVPIIYVRSLKSVVSVGAITQWGYKGERYGKNIGMLFNGWGRISN